MAAVAERAPACMPNLEASAVPAITAPVADMQASSNFTLLQDLAVRATVPITAPRRQATTRLDHWECVSFQLISEVTQALVPVARPNRRS
jgi:hypothetical protein